MVTSQASRLDRFLYASPGQAMG